MPSPTAYSIANNMPAAPPDLDRAVALEQGCRPEQVARLREQVTGGQWVPALAPTLYRTLREYFTAGRRAVARGDNRRVAHDRALAQAKRRYRKVAGSMAPKAPKAPKAPAGAFAINWRVKLARVDGRVCFVTAEGKVYPADE